MSWAGGEFCQEAPCPSQTYFDYFLQTAGVVYLAAAGNSPSASYPSTSPYVVSVGGTTLKRDISGNYLLGSPLGNRPVVVPAKSIRHRPIRPVLAASSAWEGCEAHPISRPSPTR